MIGNREISTLRSWTRVAYLDPTIPADLSEALWRAPLTVVAKGEPLRQVGSRSTVRLTWQNRVFVLKHYVEPTLRHALKQNFARSRARTTWNSAFRLIQLGIPTPQPVACVENRLGPIRGDSFLMYPYVEGQTLHAFVNGDDVRHSPLLDKIGSQLACFWQNLRRLRISLGDTNFRNFIVANAGQLWVIDVDKVRFHRMATAAARSYDRAWQQFSRSADKSGASARQLLDTLQMQV